MKPTRQDVIEVLQDMVERNRISTLDDLEGEISCADYEGEPIEAYEDILSPIDYNTCDRCGNILDSEVGLFWLDGFDWEDDNPTDQAILKALNKEQADYCAICCDCLNELKEKGIQ